MFSEVLRMSEFLIWNLYRTYEESEAKFILINSLILAYIENFSNNSRGNYAAFVSVLQIRFRSHYLERVY